MSKDWMSAMGCRGCRGGSGVEGVDGRGECSLAGGARMWAPAWSGCAAGVGGVGRAEETSRVGRRCAERWDAGEGVRGPGGVDLALEELDRECGWGLSARDVDDAPALAPLPRLDAVRDDRLHRVHNGMDRRRPRHNALPRTRRRC